MNPRVASSIPSSGRFQIQHNTTQSQIKPVTLAHTKIVPYMSTCYKMYGMEQELRYRPILIFLQQRNIGPIYWQTDTSVDP